jgi:signal transduction histidine kinase
VQVTAEPPGAGGWASLILVPASQADDTRAIIDTMMAGFAHEVRNPLAAILSLTEATASQLEEQAPARGMLERIPGLVRRVDKLIKQSLSYSRPREPQREATALESLVGWAVELAQMKKRTGVEFRQDLTEAQAVVSVDSEQIEQVLVNLLCNARDAARTRVSLEGKIVGEQVIVEVSDDGPGIDEQHRARIFEPFFTTKRHGTGLGLPIACNLARLNGGDLELARTSPWGSTFRLYLTRAAGATRAA